MHRFTLLIFALIVNVSTVYAASDAARVAGDLKVNGIHFSKDGSTMDSANNMLKNKGTWTTGTLYSVGDVVQAQSGSYICISATTTQPPNVTYWSPLGGVQGPAGPTGPANNLSIGTVASGTQAAASITGAAPSQTLNLTLPQGPTGPLATSVSISGTVLVSQVVTPFQHTLNSSTDSYVVPIGKILVIEFITIKYDMTANASRCDVSSNKCITLYTTVGGIPASHCLSNNTATSYSYSDLIASNIVKIYADPLSVIRFDCLSISNTVTSSKHSVVLSGYLMNAL